MRIAAPLLVFAAFAISGAAFAQSRHDSTAPVDVSAGHMELQDKSGRGLLSGGVKLRQAEMTLTASRVTVTYSGKVVDGSPEVLRFDAAGDVVVTRPDQTARGAYGVYDLKRRVIIMLGGVTLVQGANRVSGSRLTINLDSGKATIDGSGAVSPSDGASGVTTAPSGRVTGRFSVPKRNQ